MDGVVMVMYVDTDKLTETASPAQPSEVGNKPGGISC